MQRDIYLFSHNRILDEEKIITSFKQVKHQIYGGAQLLVYPEDDDEEFTLY